MASRSSRTSGKLAGLLIVGLIGFWFTAAPAPVCPNCSVKVAEFTVAKTGRSTAGTEEIAFKTELFVRTSTARLIEDGEVTVATHIRIVGGTEVFDLGVVEWQPDVQTRSRERGGVALEELVQLWDRPWAS
jgi:hypothetical protein